MYVTARRHHSHLWSVRLHDQCFLERLAENRREKNQDRNAMSLEENRYPLEIGLRISGKKIKRIAH